MSSSTFLPILLTKAIIVREMPTEILSLDLNVDKMYKLYVRQYAEKLEYRHRSERVNKTKGKHEFQKEDILFCIQSERQNLIDIW